VGGVVGGDWFGSEWLRDATKAWSSPLVPEALRQMVDGVAPAALAQRAVEVAGDRLAGRELELRFGDSRVHLVPTSIGLARASLGVVIGQLGDLELEARDVRWEGGRAATLRIEAGNVHIQPGTVATLVAAPIRATARFDQATVEEVVARRTTWVAVELTADGTLRASLARWRRWGRVDLVPEVEGRFLVLRPVAAEVGGRRRAVPAGRRLPGLRVELPESLVAGHVEEVGVEDGHLVVRAVLDEWREPLAPGQLDQLVRRIETLSGAVLDVPRAAAGRRG
jgi:hypothetical protein